MPATSHDLGNAKISGIKDKVYTGKPLTQNPVVKMLDDEVLERGRDYTVTLKSNKDVGYGTVLITGTGDYQNSLYLDFKILPKPTALNSLAAAKAGFTVKWRKQAAGTSGYQLQYSTSKSFAGSKTVTIGKTAAVKRDIKKLKSKKNYYVRIRTFTQVGKSRFFSTWSDVKMVRTK